MNDLIIKLISTKAMSRKQLLDALRKNGYNVSDREMRDNIHHMITELGYCIQSSSRGYELIKTRNQLDGAVRYIDSYIREFSERKRKLIENFERQKIYQLSLY